MYIVQGELNLSFLDACLPGNLSGGNLLAVCIQYKYTYKKMYIPDQTYSPTLRTQTLQLTYIPQMLAVYIQYK